MEASPTKKKQPECGFCHRGAEAERVCGPLYTSSDCNAHKKCMQYSALLVQYRTKGFGGFKKQRVVAEIKRGKSLPCSVCKNSRKRSKQPPKGATCGCAISNCRRTYHYYCAHNADNVLCRRIEVRDKDTGKTSVLYRIFCGPEHQKKFESVNGKVMEISYNSDSSATEYDSDENDDDTDIDSPPKKKTLPTMENKTGGKLTPKPAEKTTPKPNQKSAQKSNQKPAKGPKEVTPPPENNQKSSDEETKQGSRKQKRASPTPQETPGKKARGEDLNETEDITHADSPIHIGDVLYKRDCPASSPSKKADSKPDADVVLCIMEEGQHLEKFGDRIREMVAKQFRTGPSSVVFWSSNGPHQVSPQHMLYFMRDVAKAVYESNPDTLAQLITQPSAADIERYNHHVQFHADFMEVAVRDHVEERVRNIIGDHFVQKNNSCDWEVGGAFVLSELNTIFIVLPLNDYLDPNMSIRRFLLDKELAYAVDLMQDLSDPKRGNLSQKEVKFNAERELQSLTIWLQKEAQGPVKVRVRPKEVILRQSSTLSTAYLLCNHFQRQNGPGGAGCKGDTAVPAIVAMFVVPVNGEILAYGPYCRAAIGTFVKEELTAFNPIYCVLDVDDLEGFSRVSDIIPTLPDSVAVRAFSGVNPAESPVSCVILKFFIEA